MYLPGNLPVLYSINIIWCKAPGAPTFIFVGEKADSFYYKLGI